MALIKAHKNVLLVYVKLIFTSSNLENERQSNNKNYCEHFHSFSSTQINLVHAYEMKIREQNTKKGFVRLVIFAIGQSILDIEQEFLLYEEENEIFIAAYIYFITIKITVFMCLDECLEIACEWIIKNLFFCVSSLPM